MQGGSQLKTGALSSNHPADQESGSHTGTGRVLETTPCPACFGSALCATELAGQLEWLNAKGLRWPIAEVRASLCRQPRRTDAVARLIVRYTPLSRGER